MVQTAAGDRRGVSILLHLIRRGKYDGTIPTVEEEWELWLFSPAAGRKLAGETKGNCCCNPLSLPRPEAASHIC